MKFGKGFWVENAILWKLGCQNAIWKNFGYKRVNWKVLGLKLHFQKI